ncbi:lysophospholipid acyltransferase family protein [Nocardioides daphniae]|uniref:lysophospholipid acyltransferase family protein n=1 Tax=Nocardioides daphniae TaxID=402297 RepID=UPI00131519E2|nr:lysophospholipid acyltransferase family protein [Nocardioides daphniae]
MARRDLTYRTALTLGRAALRALDARVEVVGVDNIPTTGPVIIASTHVSYGDMLPIALAARGRGRLPRFMSRYDVWHARGIARPMTAMGHIPVDRAAPAAAYLQARRLLRAGETVATFPEAGISYSYTVRPLMRGTAALARETGAVVVPTALWGVQRIYSVGRPEGGVLGGKEPPPDLTRGRRIDLHFGQPLTVGPGEDLTEWTTKLGVRLTDMLEGLQTLEHHRPSPGEHAPWYPQHLGGHAPCRSEAEAWDNTPRHAVPATWGPPWLGWPRDGGASDGATDGLSPGGA